MNLISHFTFKTSISECFEKYLCEMTKQKIIQKVYIENLNTEVFAIMKNSKHLIVSSAAPYCYLSKLNFNVNVELLITSLHPSSQFPDKKNYQVGKLENIFKSIGKNIVIENFYTDNLKEDWPLAEYAKNTFLVNKNKIVKVTKEFIKTFDKSTPNLSK
jgi:hypothetical protein